MKSLLMYYYGFKDPQITKTDKFIYVKENNYLFIIYKVNYFLDNVVYTNQDDTFYRTLKNRNGEYLTFYKGTNYILLKVQNKNFMNVNEIFHNFKINLVNNQQFGWISLWKTKIDAIEQMTEKDGNNIILETRDYYIGFGETAMAFLLYNKDRIHFHEKSLCRKRINDGIFRLPTNAIIDYKERDIAEYIKYLFFQKDKNSAEITQFICKLAISIHGYDKILIYGRLLFPTYYFDLIDDYLDKGVYIKDKIELINQKMTDYEILLKNIFSLFFSNFNEIEWIKKAKSSFA